MRTIMAAEALPQSIPPQVLENCPEPCFTVSESLAITYCNSAWDRSALLNQGSPAVLSHNVTSRNLLEFIPRELKQYYLDLFATARAVGHPVSHDYECSSATLFRLYRMQIYPLTSGFAVINSLRLEHPHERVPVAPNDAVYRNGAGLIRMCANCRRTRRVDNPDAWDWVPAYLDLPYGDVSHGVCPPCLAFYYRSHLRVEHASS